MTEALNYEQLLEQCSEISRAAGVVLLTYHQTEHVISKKSDQTMVTEADKAADQLIIDGLQSLQPNLPVISEESPAPAYAIRRQWDRYWLVDPLDGTHEFIKGSEEFTVNIALIEHEKVVLGVVYAPTTGNLWRASAETEAMLLQPEQPAKTISARKIERDDVIVISGHSEKGERFQNMLKKIKPGVNIPMGSSLKICLIAEGKADLYPRLGKTSEWDTAAAQCVLERAGGHLTDTQMQPLKYNTKDSLINPEFFAFGSSNHDWSAYLD